MINYGVKRNLNDREISRYYILYTIYYSLATIYHGPPFSYISETCNISRCCAQYFFTLSFNHEIPVLFTLLFFFVTAPRVIGRLRRVARRILVFRSAGEFRGQCTFSPSLLETRIAACSLDRVSPAFFEIRHVTMNSAKRKL